MEDDEKKVPIDSFYEMLEGLAKAIPFRELDFIVRLRYGIKAKHSDNILYLYFYHLYKTGDDLYKILEGCRSEKEIKEALSNKAKSNCSGAIKSTCIYLDLFSEDFQKIINAYLDYVE